jgi:hypothetical protein
VVDVLFSELIVAQIALAGTQGEAIGRDECQLRSLPRADGAIALHRFAKLEPDLVAHLAAVATA